MKIFLFLAHSMPDLNLESPSVADIQISWLSWRAGCSYLRFDVQWPLALRLAKVAGDCPDLLPCRMGSRKFSRTAAGRVFEPELVSKSVRRDAQDRGVANGVEP